MAFEVVAYQGRTRDFSGSLYQSDGVTPFVLNASDKLRFKLGSLGGGTPTIDVVSGVGLGTSTPDAAGSSITITSLGSSSPAAPATYTVRIAEGDTASLAPCSYDAEVLQVDSQSGNPSNADRTISVGVVHVLSTTGGNTGP